MYALVICYTIDGFSLLACLINFKHDIDIKKKRVGILWQVNKWKRRTTKEALLKILVWNNVNWVYCIWDADMPLLTLHIWQKIYFILIKLRNILNIWCIVSWSRVYFEVSHCFVCLYCCAMVQNLCIYIYIIKLHALWNLGILNRIFVVTNALNDKQIYL